MGIKSSPIVTTLQQYSLWVFLKIVRLIPSQLSTPNLAYLSKIWEHSRTYPDTPHHKTMNARSNNSFTLTIVSSRILEDRCLKVGHETVILDSTMFRTPSGRVEAWLPHELLGVSVHLVWQEDCLLELALYFLLHLDSANLSHFSCYQHFEILSEGSHPSDSPYSFEELCSRWEAVLHVVSGLHFGHPSWGCENPEYGVMCSSLLVPGRYMARLFLLLA